jgi:phenylalanyl-tRNA synthetase beta chain
VSIRVHSWLPTALIRRDLRSLRYLLFKSFSCVKISLNWLKDYVNLDGISAEEISRAITFLGFEVEGIEQLGAPPLENVFVGEVLTRDKHPNADKLSVCTVDTGPAAGVKTIVCGAQNYKVGDRVPVALPGAVLPGDFVIKQSKIRGEASDGMMCSGKELGIGSDHSGLLILTDRPDLGTPINAVLPGGDTVFDLEITPNRPDCLSHLGLARELAAWFRQPLRLPEISEPAASAPRTDLLREVRVEAAEDCPVYSATVVTGVQVGPSPRWLQERLAAIGLRPINNLVDIGNYVMFEYGQPLHAFDARKLGGATIIVRHAAEGEKITTLDDKERTLDAKTLVIADAAQPVVVAGIMGGVNSGVDESTVDLVLEAAIFKRQSTRATSKRLGLSSDSSYRYERGVDPHQLDAARRRALNLILQIAGGTVCGPVQQVGQPTPWDRQITVAPEWIRKQLGFSIPYADMRAALEALQLRVIQDRTSATGDAEWTVAVPTWRDDLDRPIDLVEEALRLHGTEKIPAATVTAPGLLQEDDPVTNFARRTSAILVGQGFSECVSYTLRSAEELAAWGSDAERTALALANPFVEDQSHLRPTLISGLLESLALNRSRGVPAVRLFETGRLFVEREGQVLECLAVGFVIAEEGTPPSWLNRAPSDFYTTKRLVETLAGEAGIDLARQPLLPNDTATRGWQAGHHAVLGDMAHGWSARFGLLDLALTQSLGLPGKVFGGLLSLLPAKVPGVGSRRRYQPFSLFPAALRDLAVVVEETRPAGDVQKELAKAARQAAGSSFAIESVRVFDVYRGTGVPEGHKSLAFSLAFRSAERTLTDEEVNGAFTRLQEDLTKKGFSIRK